ncbi:MAG: AI-2E family transporter [Nitrincola lacisaponensis]|uniref:Putative transport protein n=1 Tax=Nitrincola lacisaponensis TaxID=267850 RepID=A0A063Y4H5_9GAMM|nr:AI-2E family transporter [Nitrincola lacisaponensis]KDE41238.1 putative transport protein [Nitrincola lacisaponensis]
MSDNHGLKWLLGIAGVVVILAGLKAAEAIVIPIMLALFIAIISTPFLRGLTRRGVPSYLAVLLVLSVLIVFGGALVMIVSQSIDAFLTRLPLYQSRLQTLIVDWLPYLERWDIPVNRDMVMTHLNPSQMMGLVGSALAGIGSLLTNLFLVIFIVIFILLEEAGFSDKVKAALPNADKSIRDAQGFMKQVNQYLMIKTTISFITGVMVTLWLWWLDVDFPVLWGLIAMLMNYIPNVGSLIAAVPAVLLALVQLGLGDAMLVVLGYVMINVLMGNLIEPRFMGRGLGLSPLVVFLSLILWGWLFGPVGMFLSIPLTMIVKIALEQHPGTRWIAILLGNDVPKTTE